MSLKTHQTFMRVAIAKAEKGIKAGQAPFGSCIVKGDRVVASAHNHVWKNTDITAHAEIQAIRETCRRLKTIDLSGCVLYSTCEPCPMCFSACHWAGIEKIYYGAGITDAKWAGFNELTISVEAMKKSGRSPVKLEGGLLKKENCLLFEKWIRKPDRRAY